MTHNNKSPEKPGRFRMTVMGIELCNVVIKKFLPVL